MKTNKKLSFAIGQHATTTHGFCRMMKKVGYTFSSSQIGAWISGKESPYLDDGELRVPAERLVEALGIGGETLFPRAFYGAERGTTVSVDDIDPDREVDASDIVEARLDGPDILADIVFVNQLVERMLATLTPREEKVLRLRFGIGEKSDHTLEEVGQVFELTRDRIRQIEAKALSKLRQAIRLYLDEDSDENLKKRQRAMLALRAFLID